MQPSRMALWDFAGFRRTFLLAGLTSLAACTLATPAPKAPDAPDAPDAGALSEAAEPMAASAQPASGPAQPPTQTTAPRADLNSIPDDYYITASDCHALGNQYGQAVRADQLATLSPRLSDKLRAVGMEAIDKAVPGLEEKWIAQCESSLVGKVGDPKALKCALNASTGKAFDVCLNGESSSHAKSAASGAKKSN
jgi:hypothetical protein